MYELARLNDLVSISLIESLLKEDGITYFVFDQHMSVLEGSIGILPRRIMVSLEEKNRAVQLLKDAGLGKFVKSDDNNH